MEASKKFLIFSRIKAFLLFPETETSKKFFIFQETELSYISESNFPCSKNEKNSLLKSFLYLGEMDLSNYKLKILLTFQERTEKAPETNKKSAPKTFLVSFDVLVIFRAVKHREIPCD